MFWRRKALGRGSAASGGVKPDCGRIGHNCTDMLLHPVWLSSPQFLTPLLIKASSAGSLSTQQPLWAQTSDGAVAYCDHIAACAVTAACVSGIKIVQCISHLLLLSVTAVQVFCVVAAPAVGAMPLHQAATKSSLTVDGCIQGAPCHPRRGARQTGCRAKGSWSSGHQSPAGGTPSDICRPGALTLLGRGKTLTVGAWPGG